VGVSTWLGRLLAGSAWRIAEQVEAQPRKPLDLPAEITLGDTTLTLRHIGNQDREAILAFANQLPPHDLLFLRRDITEPDQVDHWLRDAEEGLTITILAVRGSEIVGYASVAGDGLSWTRHVRELRVMVGSSMRGRNLGRLLTEQAFAVAKEAGVKKMVAQMTTDQAAAIRVFERMGFEAEARLRNQVIDRDGRLHDLQIMTLDVDAFQSKIDVALLTAQQPFMNV
jgi:L-amino acid N-acyltransferase YncA